MIARASASERTLGRRLRLGARTLFLRTATTRGRACGQRETGCRYVLGERCRGPGRAHREDAADNYAPPPRSADRVHDDSMRPDRELLGCRPPVSRVPSLPTPCPRSSCYATPSSRCSSFEHAETSASTLRKRYARSLHTARLAAPTAKPFRPMRLTLRAD